MAGFQSVNGNSSHYIADSINTFHFSMALLDIRISNMENPVLKEELIKIFNSEDLNDEFIKNQMPTRTQKEFSQTIINNISDEKVSKETIIKRIKKELNKENRNNKRKISIIKAQNLTNKIINHFNINISENIIKSSYKLKKLFENNDPVITQLKNCLKSEKRVVIFIDNYSVHKTLLSQLICKILNIKLIYLPKYSPFLNPIEQLWRTMKNIIHRNYISDYITLKELVIENFNELVDNESFFKNWDNTYIAKK